jgi:hypothetical protein
MLEMFYCSLGGDCLVVRLGEWEMELWFGRMGLTAKARTGRGLVGRETEDEDEGKSDANKFDCCLDL